MVNPDTPINEVRFDPVEASTALGVVVAGAVGVVVGEVGVVVGEVGVVVGEVGGVVSAAVVKFKVVGLVIPVKALSERSKMTPLAIST